SGSNIQRLQLQASMFNFLLPVSVYDNNKEDDATQPPVEALIYKDISTDSRERGSGQQTKDVQSDEDDSIQKASVTDYSKLEQSRAKDAGEVDNLVSTALKAGDGNPAI
ncbi:hypothetical protein RRG08_062586, partial [Elysia crispata]